MESWKRNVIFTVFWLWICLILVGQHLESKRVLLTPKPFQLIENTSNITDEIADIEKFQDNVISLKYEEIKKAFLYAHESNDYEQNKNSWQNETESSTIGEIIYPMDSQIFFTGCPTDIASSLKLILQSLRQDICKRTRYL